MVDIFLVAALISFVFFGISGTFISVFLASDNLPFAVVSVAGSRGSSFESITDLREDTASSNGLLLSFKAETALLKLATASSCGFLYWKYQKQEPATITIKRMIIAGIIFFFFIISYSFLCINEKIK